MKALILNNQVVQTAAQEFEVHSDFQWVDCDEAVQSGWSLDGSQFTAPLQPTAEELLERLRAKRNSRLSQSDWTQAVDAPLTPEQKTEWQTYRQALRDITDTYSSPEDVVWPTKPE
jgi:hypothetical protein